MNPNFLNHQPVHKVEQPRKNLGELSVRQANNSKLIELKKHQIVQPPDKKKLYAGGSSTLPTLIPLQKKYVPGRQSTDSVRKLEELRKQQSNPPLQVKIILKDSGNTGVELNPGVDNDRKNKNSVAIRNIPQPSQTEENEEPGMADEDKEFHRRDAIANQLMPASINFPVPGQITVKYPESPVVVETSDNIIASTNTNTVYQTPKKSEVRPESTLPMTIAITGFNPEANILTGMALNSFGLDSINDKGEKTELNGVPLTDWGINGPLHVIKPVSQPPSSSSSVAHGGINNQVPAADSKKTPTEIVVISSANGLKPLYQQVLAQIKNVPETTTDQLDSNISRTFIDRRNSDQPFASAAIQTLSSQNQDPELGMAVKQGATPIGAHNGNIYYLQPKHSLPKEGVINSPVLLGITEEGRVSRYSSLVASTIVKDEQINTFFEQNDPRYNKEILKRVASMGILGVKYLQNPQAIESLDTEDQTKLYHEISKNYVIQVTPHLDRSSYMGIASQLENKLQELGLWDEPMEILKQNTISGSGRSITPPQNNPLDIRQKVQNKFIRSLSHQTMGLSQRAQEFYKNIFG